MAVIETLTFRLADGATIDDFLAADRRVQTEFAYRQAGLLRRTTARADDGAWIVIELWDDAEAADTARSSAESDDAVAAFVALLDAASVVRRRYETLD